MTVKIFDRTVSAGVAHKPITKKADKELTDLLKRLGGSVAWVADKGTCLEFPNESAARQWCRRAEQLGCYPERWED